MKTVAYSQFGGIEVLQIENEDTPKAKASEVLVQVKAVSINPLDWKIRQGDMTFLSGSNFPKHIGLDFAGIVQSVGEGVVNFKTGDPVLGAVINAMKEGALGEYVVVPAKSLWHKPDGIGFTQAAAIPIAGAGAHAAIVDIAKVKPGTDILLNGATGGMGMFALQLAKQRGAHVTAVTSAKGVAFAQKWGADVVVDYTKTNILTEGKRYDAIFDLSAKMTFDEAKAILKPESVFIDSVPTPIQIIGTTIANLFTSQKHKMLLSNVNDNAMRDILTAVEDNGLTIEVGKVFPFDQFADAYRYAEAGGFVGKVVIEVS